jgi:hypothetical protein
MFVQETTDNVAEWLMGETWIDSGRLYSSVQEIGSQTSVYMLSR